MATHEASTRLQPKTFCKLLSAATKQTPRFALLVNLLGHDVRPVNHPGPEVEVDGAGTPRKQYVKNEIKGPYRCRLLGLKILQKNFAL